MEGLADDAASVGIETEMRESEAVLQAVSGEQRGDAVNIAEAEDEGDDGLRSDGIEAGGGRIVEDDLRASDQSASDRDAAAHSSGKLGGEHVDGVFEFDELQNFEDAGLDFAFVDLIFAEAVGNVVSDGHGIEQGAFLKDKADLTTKREEVMFRHGGDFVAEDTDGTL